ncbi:hypothetical protein CGLO_06090 [Colletotrichum gloeosporioides Cg-14]|uniref:Uncharacterized protein n=1 Tax=Colletotrichum gloeosporioides (strain Cg-14) TaxID=1237896 RepID=T0KQ43_COLGC|nr:hypothetical protein CGLO_06090 [Colletotrichum gloeosporioides Cg-14]
MSHASSEGMSRPWSYAPATGASPGGGIQLNHKGTHECPHPVADLDAANERECIPMATRNRRDKVGGQETKGRPRTKGPLTGGQRAG